MTTTRRSGNVLLIVIIVFSTVAAATVAVVLSLRGAAIETKRDNATASSARLDTMLQPVSEWAASAITTWSTANEGALPSDAEGKSLIAGLKSPPDIEGAADFKATPVYRKMGDKNFEIVVSTADLDGSAHLVYPFTAAGRLLAPVEDNIFLQADPQRTDPLETEASDGTTPR